MTDWIQRWKDNKIGWHRDEPNSKLIEFVSCLQLNTGDTVFVPLCGKSKDMLYLAQQGYKVIGVELSALAVEQFFTDNKIVYQVSQEEDFEVYHYEFKDSNARVELNAIERHLLVCFFDKGFYEYSGNKKARKKRAFLQVK